MHGGHGRPWTQGQGQEHDVCSHDGMVMDSQQGVVPFARAPDQGCWLAGLNGKIVAKEGGTHLTRIPDPVGVPLPAVCRARRDAVAAGVAGRDAQQEAMEQVRMQRGRL